MARVLTLREFLLRYPSCYPRDSRAERERNAFLDTGALPEMAVAEDAQEDTPALPAEAPAKEAEVSQGSLFPLA